MPGYTDVKGPRGAWVGSCQLCLLVALGEMMLCHLNSLPTCLERLHIHVMLPGHREHSSILSNKVLERLLLCSDTETVAVPLPLGGWLGTWLKGGGMGIGP